MFKTSKEMILGKNILLLIIYILFIILLLLASPILNAYQNNVISHSGKVFALVIGNDNYHSDAKLANPVNDAKAIASLLKKQKFDVTLGINLNKENLDRLIKDFSIKAKINQNSIVLFYFAGHGLNINGVNYILPIGNDYKTYNDVKRSAITLDSILIELRKTIPAAGIVILDACRNNPYQHDIRENQRSLNLPIEIYPPTPNNSSNPQLSILPPQDNKMPTNFFIAYSAGFGSIAIDGLKDGNSPYAKALLDNFDNFQHLSIVDIFANITNTVAKSTQEKQRPVQTTTLKGTLYLVKSPELTIPKTPVSNLIEILFREKNLSKDVHQAASDIKEKYLLPSTLAIINSTPVSTTTRGFNIKSSYILLAQQGDSEAQNQLGMDYLLGINGQSKNSQQAVYWFRKAAERNLDVAQLNLGIQYHLGNGVPKNEQESIKWVHQAASQGLIPAQTRLGAFYGIKKNYQESFKWFNLAAQQKDPIAQFHVGLIYMLGQSVKKNATEGFRWLLLSAQQGYTPAQQIVGSSYLYGTDVPKNPVEALRWLKLAAQSGHAEAQLNLGTMYVFGHGVQVNYTEAIKWYRSSAQQGNSLAQISLGLAYVRGQGVSKNEAEAFKWLNLAANQKNSIAQILLSILYLQKGNRSQSQYWLNTAKNNSQATSDDQILIKYVSDFFTLLPKLDDTDDKNPITLITQAANNGNSFAILVLGGFYEHGLYTQKNLYMANYWYGKAANVLGKEFFNSSKASWSTTMLDLKNKLKK